jgi:arabinan endo-1,5-alpha-L-arabinosidase
LDEAGSPWLAYGSFWSGVQMIRLDQNGERVGTELVSLASRGGGAIEAPFLVRRCGFYYLFVSFDACCQGADSTYNTRVGRSRELLGPYLARNGTPMLEGGGTLVLQAGGDWVGPGHNAILIDGTRAYNVYHAYAASNGASQLRISELVWDVEGWPISGGP